MKKIRIGLYGYGNLAKGIESNLANFQDIELTAVFTRRDPDTIGSNYPVYSIRDIFKFRNKIDVLIMCGGSATDLPAQSPQMIKYFNIIDSFDTHAKILAYFKKLNKLGKEYKHLSVLSCGWDPGLFSIARLMFNAFLPDGNDYTFWGKGISQGHSDALRHIDGVLDARQYTIPKEEAMSAVKSGRLPKLSIRDKHLRECFIVAKSGADKRKIEQTIKHMPDYFADYDTIVHFVTMQELNKHHAKLPHGGHVFRSGKTNKNNHLLELSINLESNPEFTSGILLCFVRACYKLRNNGKTGAVTPFDIPLGYLSDIPQSDLIRKFL